MLWSIREVWVEVCCSCIFFHLRIVLIGEELGTASFDRKWPIISKVFRHNFIIKFKLQYFRIVSSCFNISIFESNVLPFAVSYFPIRTKWGWWYAYISITGKQLSFKKTQVSLSTISRTFFFSLSHLSSLWTVKFIFHQIKNHVWRTGAHFSDTGGYIVVVINFDCHLFLRYKMLWEHILLSK